MPYNYILDPTICEKMKIKMENSIIIFDEAHNIENTAEEGSSLSLNSVEMKNAFDMLKNLVKAFK